jgi:prohibitin 1
VIILWIISVKRTAVSNVLNRRLIGKWILGLLLAVILLTPVVIVDAGQRGVLMQFGKVQTQILGEGLHLIVPLMNTVKTLSVRVPKQESPAEAS